MGHWLLGHCGPSLWLGALASAKGEGERPRVLRCGPSGLRAGDGLHGGDEGMWYGHPATLCRRARPSCCRLRGSPRAHPRPADVGDPAQELAQRHWEVFVGTGKRRLPERERVSAGTERPGHGVTAKKEKEAALTEICLFLTRACARLLQHPMAHPAPFARARKTPAALGGSGWPGRGTGSGRQLPTGWWSVRNSTSSRSTSQIHEETDRQTDRAAGRGGRVPEDGERAGWRRRARSEAARRAQWRAEAGSPRVARKHRAAPARHLRSGHRLRGVLVLVVVGTCQEAEAGRWGSSGVGVQSPLLAAPGARGRGPGSSFRAGVAWLAVAPPLGAPRGQGSLLLWGAGAEAGRLVTKEC